MNLGIREILLRLHLCLINFVVILLQNLVFCRNLEQEAMNVSILILRVHLILLRNFNWILIADISMKWRNVRII